VRLVLLLQLQLVLLACPGSAHPKPLLVRLVLLAYPGPAHPKQQLLP